MARNVRAVALVMVSVALVVAGLWSVRRGGEEPPISVRIPGEVAGVGQGVADLGDVLPGRLGELAVDRNRVVAYSGTDFELDHRETLIASSDDGGATFRRLQFDESLAGLAAVVHGNQLVIVGQRCDPPNDSNDAVCDSEAAEMQGFAIDLDGGEVTKLPDIPVRGSVSEAIGVVRDRVVLLAQSDVGPTLLSVGSDGAWTATEAPTETSAVCAVGDRLVAVASAAPLGSGTSSSGAEVDSALVEGSMGIPEVGQGQPLWSASTSSDGGETWSDPEPFDSDLGRDFSFELGVSCGPRFVVVHTAQMAAFDVDSGVWHPIALPEELRGAIPPGSAMAWSTPDALTTWTLPESTAPPPTVDATGGDVPRLPAGRIRVVNIANIGSQARVSVTGTTTTDEGQPVKVSPSAEAAGLVIEIQNDTANLGRLG